MVAGESPRALCLEPEFYDEHTVRRIQALGVEWVPFQCEGVKQLNQVLIDARDSKRPFTAIFIRLGLYVGSETFDAAGPALRRVFTPTTGLSHIDVETALDRSIEVVALKGAVDLLRTIPSTAEHTWALLLALVRNIPGEHKNVCDGEWDRGRPPPAQLAGKVLGIVGLGRLGTMVASFGRGFAMDVIAHDCDARVFQREGNEHVIAATLQDVVAQADVLSLHLPLEPSTERILDEELIRSMKPEAILLNTARGELIDETALLNALSTRAIRGAAVDVLVGDAGWSGSVPRGHPLVEYARGRPNLIITPHIGGFTLEAVLATRKYIAGRFFDLVCDSQAH